jgi:hypothetical protein
MCFVVYSGLVEMGIGGLWVGVLEYCMHVKMFWEMLIGTSTSDMARRGSAGVHCEQETLLSRSSAP